MVNVAGVVPYRTLKVTLVLELTNVSHLDGVKLAFNLGPRTVPAAGLTITQVNVLSTGLPDVPEVPDLPSFPSVPDVPDVPDEPDPPVLVFICPLASFTNT